MAAKTFKGASTRARMLDVSIGLMRRSGLAGAGINEIAKASSVPKGSVYHYFPQGKQQVVTEALEIYVQRVQEYMTRALSSETTPKARVRALFNAVAKRLEDSYFHQSCAAGAVCLDLDEELEEVRKIVDAAFETWIDLLASQIGISQPQRARSFAGLMLTTLQGTWIRGRAQKSGQPFIEAGEWLAEIAERETPST